MAKQQIFITIIIITIIAIIGTIKTMKTIIAIIKIILISTAIKTILIITIKIIKTITKTISPHCHYYLNNNKISISKVTKVKINIKTIISKIII